MTYIYISDVVEIVDRFYEGVKKETRPTVENKVPFLKGNFLKKNDVNN